MTSSRPIFELKNTTYKLSIQLNLNGFSFCIVNSKEEIIASEDYFSNEYVLSEQELYTKITTAFNTKPELQAKFEKVVITYTNELYSFVPKDLFDAKHKELYFKFSIKTLATDLICDDELKSASIVNLFIPYVNINNYLLDHFNQFNFHHHSAVLVDYILSKKSTENSTGLYLYFHSQHFDIIAIKEGELLLCNTYNQHSKEDVLYYLLFVIEQLGYSPETVYVELLNLVPDEYFGLLYTYIRNINKTSKPFTNLIHHLALHI